MLVGKYGLLTQGNFLNKTGMRRFVSWDSYVRQNIIDAAERPADLAGEHKFFGFTDIKYSPSMYPIVEGLWW